MIEFILFIQSLSSPVLNWLLTIFNLLSQQYFLVVLVATVYWIVNKEKGERLAASLIFATCLSCGLKGVFHTDRPFIADSRVKAINKGTAPGYSFPSADSSAAASVATALGTMTKNRVVWGLLGIYTLLIGFCRIYFGLHYPTDVLGGFAVGIAVSVILYFAEKRCRNINVFYIAFALLLAVFIFFPHQQKDYYNAFGLTLGAVCGIIIEHKFVNFSCNISKKQKTLRLTIGLLGVILISICSSLFSPDTPIFFVFDKFALTFFATGIYPLIFKKCNF